MLVYSFKYPLFNTLAFGSSKYNTREYSVNAFNITIVRRVSVS